MPRITPPHLNAYAAFAVALLAAACSGGGSGSSGSPAAASPQSMPNRAPVVAKPLADLAVRGKRQIAFDFTQGGATFVDPDGDPLFYYYDNGIVESPGLAYQLIDAYGKPRRLDLSDEDKDALEAFLHTLTDEAFLADPKFADPF
jgi:hypothetical protein